MMKVKQVKLPVLLTNSPSIRMQGVIGVSVGHWMAAPGWTVIRTKNRVTVHYFMQIRVPYGFHKLGFKHLNNSRLV